MRTIFKSLTLAGTIIISCNLYAQAFVDTALKPYFESFKNECSIRGVEISANIICVKFPHKSDYELFKFDELKPGWVGVAITNNITKEILIFIEPRGFYMSDTTGREMVVYHELMHACFRLPHFNNPLMHDGQLTDNDAVLYKQNRKSILDDIFKHIKNE